MYTLVFYDDSLLVLKSNMANIFDIFTLWKEAPRQTLGLHLFSTNSQRRWEHGSHQEIF